MGLLLNFYYTRRIHNSYSKTKSCVIQDFHLEMDRRNDNTLERDPRWSRRCTDNHHNTKTHIHRHFSLFPRTVPEEYCNFLSRGSPFLVAQLFRYFQWFWCDDNSRRWNFHLCSFVLLGYGCTAQRYTADHLEFDSCNTVGNCLKGVIASIK